jgi:chaperonin cofactor prefoldin
MGIYDQAMLASPVARPILDNVAEALAALTPQERASTMAQQAAADFRDQDAVLQTRLARDGFFRWGSSWVSAEQLTQLKLDAEKLNRQLDGLQDQIDAIQQRMGQIDSEIDQNTRLMHRMEANSYVAGENGIIYQVQLPMAYYQLSDDNRKLASDRMLLQNQQDNVRARMNQIQDQQRQSPTPQFTGQQRILGVEAAPVRTFASATTAPATQP